MGLWYSLIILHARIQEILSGEGGPGQSTTSFLVLNLQKSNWFFSKKTIIYQDSRGGPTFSGGGGGSNCLFPIGTQITCDFPGSGFGPPVPPLDPHMKTHSSDVLLKV